MVRKSLSTVPKPFNIDKYVQRIGLGKEQHVFWKTVGKRLFQTHMVVCFIWWFNETSPLGWFNLKARPKEEKEMAHMYERIVTPYPGDEEAMEEFIKKGGMMGSIMGPKGYVEADQATFSKVMKEQKLENEAAKLWMRMRGEVVSELQEKGFRVE